ncbi:hypothetical protein M2454_001913 [Aequitasia blattaphilus]|uniref:N-acetylmuramoyl-L-alanine amidase n=1 Tax=Aequitasia blattaphilus TaxID=2949332 RepID=A0ABT1E9U5_9FIRM|nr:N-acetylmuramoyl-L-alanine amidase [Aequitasia blattaphilus]MCP1102601.1 N-acetylmuramoyl-L-alanine amidase [Aequitasia blattaphilus]MCR8615241.1 N-acetylmuramoyl-L-alanine amidase [Aequitasia blattaphilus]
MAKVFVITGHGGVDSGASGFGFTEAERIRALAARMKALGGADVTIGDTSIDYYSTGAISNLNLPAGTQIVELHLDAASSTARGGHVIIKPGLTPDAIDNAIADFISGYFQGRSNKIVNQALSNADRAAAKGYPYRLVECCFITNHADLTKFNNNLDAIARGLLNAMGIKTEEVKKTGWEQVGKKWKYKKNGKYVVNDWVSDKGAWYFIGADGFMMTGWIKTSGKWYYLNPVSGKKHHDGKTYKEGQMVTGWLYDAKRWFYLSTKYDDANGIVLGAMIVGLYVVAGIAYYFCPAARTKELKVAEGQMVTGKVAINCNFNSSGGLIMKQ